jgi:hypothetical protein
MRWTLSLLVGAAVTIVAGPAIAKDSIFHERTVTLAGHLGLGAPVGFAGLTGEWTPREWVALGAGGGMGLSGVQGVVGGRLRWIVDERLAVFAGASVSVGPYEWTELVFDAPSRKRSTFALWTNLEAGVEGMAPSGFTARFSGGYGRLLNDDALRCPADDHHCQEDHRDAGENIPFVDLALGFAL